MRDGPDADAPQRPPPSSATPPSTPPPVRSTSEGRIVRNASILVALTMVSRVAGLVRDFMITHVFGASGATDVFYMAFTIPNVLRRLVAEGTVTTVVQPAYQRVRTRDGDIAAKRLYASVGAFVLMAVIIIAVVGVVFAGPIVFAFASGFAPEKLALTTALTRYLFPVVVTMGLAGLTMAVLNAHDEYASPALSPIILNLAMITGTVVGARVFDPPILGIVVGVLVGGVLQVLAQVPALLRHGLIVRPRFDFASPEVRHVLRQFIPGLFSLAVYQINIIVLRQLASYMPEGSVSWYYTADRLMELTNGVFAIAIAQGAFSAMNERAAHHDLDGLKRIWRSTFDLTNLIAIPAALGLALLAEPIVAVLFLHGKFTWHDVQQTALTVTTASFGLVFGTSVRGTLQVFYALEDRKTPVWISIVVVAVNFVLGTALMTAGVGVAGLSFTLSVSTAVQAILLMVFLRRKVGALGVADVLKAGLVKLAVAVVAVGAAFAVARLGSWEAGTSVGNIFVLGIAIAVAVLLYGGGAMALRLRGADAVADKVLRKLRRRH
jgi:putative peptidoglycan lipid II flippase